MIHLWGDQENFQVVETAIMSSMMTLDQLSD